MGKDIIVPLLCALALSDVDVAGVGIRVRTQIVRSNEKLHRHARQSADKQGGASTTGMNFLIG